MEDLYYKYKKYKKKYCYSRNITEIKYCENLENVDFKKKYLKYKKKYTDLKGGNQMAFIPKLEPFFLTPVSLPNNFPYFGQKP